MIHLVSPGETLGLAPQPYVQTSPAKERRRSNLESHSAWVDVAMAEAGGRRVPEAPWAVFTDPIRIQHPRKNLVFYWYL